MLDNLNILFIAPQFAVALLLEGLLIGAVFALIAYGLALVWGVMNVKNLAQGDFVILGGYVCWWLQSISSPIHVHPLIGLFFAAIVTWLIAGGMYGTPVQRLLGRVIRLEYVLVAVIIAMVAAIYDVPVLPQIMAVIGIVAFVLGGGIFGIIIRPVLDRDLFTSLLSTFGVAIVMAQLLNILFGSDTQTVDLGWGSLSMLDDSVLLAWQKILAFGIAGLLAVSLVIFMKRTRMGQAIRATAQNARAARVMGIDTDKVYAFTFSLNGLICGAAGALVVMIWVIQPFYGITYSILAFVIVTAAGLGNLPGVIAAGLGMGSLEQFGGFILGAEYQQAIVVGLLLVVLAVRLVQQNKKRQAVA